MDDQEAAKKHEEFMAEMTASTHIEERKTRNIYQRINMVMAECEYLQKDQAAQGKGVKYDDVVGMIRKILIKHGIAPVVTQKSMIKLDTPTKQPIYQGEYELGLVNIDNPEEKVIHSAFAHGMDGGDKGPGKSHTYAAKLMLMKAFLIETGEDEESRAEREDKKHLIDKDQWEALAAYCLHDGKWSPIGEKLAKAYNIAGLASLPESKFEEALDRCRKLAEAQSNANN